METRGSGFCCLFNIWYLESYNVSAGGIRRNWLVFWFANGVPQGPWVLQVLSLPMYLCSGQIYLNIGSEPRISLLPSQLRCLNGGSEWEPRSLQWMVWGEPPRWGFRPLRGGSSDTPHHPFQMFFSSSCSPGIHLHHQWKDIYPLILVRCLITCAFWHFTYQVKYCSLRMITRQIKRTLFLKSRMYFIFWERTEGIHTILNSEQSHPSPNCLVCHQRGHGQCESGTVGGSLEQKEMKQRIQCASSAPESRETLVCGCGTENITDSLGSPKINKWLNRKRAFKESR